MSSGIRDADGRCKNDAFVLFTDVYKFVDWIKNEVESGYILANENNKVIASHAWKSNDALCEYIIDDG